LGFFCSGVCDDAALWQALELVGLKPLVRSFTLGLDHVLSTAADTISTGERQVC
jgi:ABC-type transport system involved in cytochrome bd biosynthesis fused ATPase/permease subunit